MSSLISRGSTSSNDKDGRRDRDGRSKAGPRSTVLDSGVAGRVSVRSDGDGETDLDGTGLRTEVKRRGVAGAVLA